MPEVNNALILGSSYIRPERVIASLEEILERINDGEDNFEVRFRLSGKGNTALSDSINNARKDGNQYQFDYNNQRTIVEILNNTNAINRNGIGKVFSRLIVREDSNRNRRFYLVFFFVRDSNISKPRFASARQWAMILDDNDNTKCLYYPGKKSNLVTNDKLLKRYVDYKRENPSQRIINEILGYIQELIRQRREVRYLRNIRLSEGANYVEGDFLYVDVTNLVDDYTAQPGKARRRRQQPQPPAHQPQSTNQGTPQGQDQQQQRQDQQDRVRVQKEEEQRRDQQEEQGNQQRQDQRREEGQAREQQEQREEEIGLLGRIKGWLFRKYCESYLGIVMDNYKRMMRNGTPLKQKYFDRLQAYTKYVFEKTRNKDTIQYLLKKFNDLTSLYAQKFEDLKKNEKKKGGFWKLIYLSSAILGALIGGPLGLIAYPTSLWGTKTLGDKLWVSRTSNPGLPTPNYIQRLVEDLGNYAQRFLRQGQQ